MKIADLSEDQLNYLVAKSLNRQWHYPWLLSEEDYESWQSAEVSEGATGTLITAQAGPLSARS